MEDKMICSLCGSEIKGTPSFSAYAPKLGGYFCRTCYNKKTAKERKIIQAKSLLYIDDRGERQQHCQNKKEMDIVTDIKNSISISDWAEKVGPVVIKLIKKKIQEELTSKKLTPEERIELEKQLSSLPENPDLLK